MQPWFPLAQTQKRVKTMGRLTTVNKVCQLQPGEDIRYPDVGNALSEYCGGFMLNAVRRSAKRLQ